MNQNEPEESRLKTIAWDDTSIGKKFIAITVLFIVLVISIMIMIWTWSSPYRILFSSLNDRDAVTVLNTLYSNGFDAKLDESTGAILVPASEIHYARIKLSNLGLPGIINQSPIARNGSYTPGYLISDPGNRNYDRDEGGQTQRMEEAISRKIEHLLEPLTGTGSVRAQVTINDILEKDIYGKNKADNSIINTKQLENQKDSTAKLSEKAPNYLNKNNNLSVTVLVDDKKYINKEGEIIRTPRSPGELEEITDIVKEVVSFNSNRGDSVNVLNTKFSTSSNLIANPGSSFMGDPRYPDWLRKVIGIFLLLVLFSFALLYISKTFFGSNLNKQNKQGDDVKDAEHPLDPVGLANKHFENNMHTANILVNSDPKLVAQILRNWVTSDGR